jgi:predicted extracellular nuclease
MVLVGRDFSGWLLWILAALLSTWVSSGGWADVLINELDADTQGTDTQEFLELFDGGVGNQSLNGYYLVAYNGNGDQAYRVLDLGGYQTDAQGFFLICTRLSVWPGCALTFHEGDNSGIQNGADAVALYFQPSSVPQNGDAIVLDGLVDALVYDTSDADDPELLSLMLNQASQVNENEFGSKTTHSIQRCGDGLLAGDQFQVGEVSPGGANLCGEALDGLGSCGESASLISQIQGDIRSLSSDESPLAGQVVVVEALVTQVAESGGRTGDGKLSDFYQGFWLQEEDLDSDGDPATSEGIFVDTGSQPLGVSPGDLVRLMGRVIESESVTQLTDIQDLLRCGSGMALPASTELDLPFQAELDLEALEGMRVINGQPWVVSDFFGAGYGLGNYGQFVASSQLHFQPTDRFAPESAAAEQAALAHTLDRLLIDDGVEEAHPEFIPFPVPTGYGTESPLRVGDGIEDIQGVLHATSAHFLLVPSNQGEDSGYLPDIRFDAQQGERSLAPEVSPNAELLIASMNLLNYFNGNGIGSGFPTARGASTFDAFQAQSAKLVAAIVAMDADIVGLIEIENDGYGSRSAIQGLLNELNQHQSPEQVYDVVEPDVSPMGSDEIAVGLLYRPSRVERIGGAQVLDSMNSPRDDHNQVLFDSSKHRPSLIQTFEFEGFRFRVSVNHLKSKGSSCNEPNEGSDGQGNCNQTRTSAAQGLAQFLAAESGDVEALLIVGDLNAYSMEDPIQVLQNAGYMSLSHTEGIATEAEPFSYTFNGQLGSLDHAMANEHFAEKVVSAGAWHINSVEDVLMDYYDEENGHPFSAIDRYSAEDPYRSSDHDPILVGIRVNRSPLQMEAVPALILSVGEVVNLPLAPYFTDPDGDTLMFSSAGLPDGWSLSSAGLLEGPVTAELIGILPLTLALQVTDGEASLGFSVTITADESAAGQSPSDSEGETPEDLQDGSEQIPEDSATIENTPEASQNRSEAGGAMSRLGMLCLVVLILVPVTGSCWASRRRRSPLYHQPGAIVPRDPLENPGQRQYSRTTITGGQQEA